MKTNYESFKIAAVGMCILVMASLPSCKSGSGPLFERPPASAERSVFLKRGEPAPHDGWLVPGQDYDYLLRCGDYVQTHEIKVY